MWKDWASDIIFTEFVSIHLILVPYDTIVTLNDGMVLKVGAKLRKIYLK